MSPSREPSRRGVGTVWLVGAGPGDPELLTLKAVRVLGRADVVLVDDLVDRAVLAHVREGARILHVGKRGGCRSTPQAFIHRLMVRYARRGCTVVRLKGGDPFVFGRGGEECDYLRAADIPVEVVSGVTAGIAAPAAAGIPVTHRDWVKGVTLVTGHTRDGTEPDWRALAASGTTLVVYMGVKRLADIAERLMAAGLSRRTPAAMVQSGTTATQRAVVAPLEFIAAETSAADIQSPAVLVVGEVAAFADAESINATRRVA